MKRFSFDFKDAFSRMGRSVKSAFGRFPAVFVLGLVMAVAGALQISEYEIFSDMDVADLEAAKSAFEKRLDFLFRGCSLGMSVSVAVQLLLERRLGRKTLLVFHAAAAILSALALPALVSSLGEPYSFLAFIGPDLAIAAAICFMLTRRQGTDLMAANSVVAFVLAWIFSLLVLAGFLLLFFAFTTLVMSLGEVAKAVTMGLCMMIPTCVVFPCVFVAYAAREREEISVSAAYKTVVMKVLFPISFALLALLYAYFFKRLFMRSLPVGTLNRFISVASAAYLFLYFASLPFEGNFILFFRKRGALFIAPLLALQIVTFVGRVNEYGFTWTKAAGLFYIIFSVAATALTFFKQGKYSSVSFLVLAAALFLGSMGPLNIEDMTNRSQLARIEKIYRSHGLFKDGAPVAEGAKDLLSKEEMKTVYDAYEKFNEKNERLPEWARAEKIEFESTFGFSKRMLFTGSERQMSFRLETKDAPLDVSSYSRILRFSKYKNGVKGKIAIVVEIDGETFDLTDALHPLMTEKKDAYMVDSEEPLVIPVSGGRSLVLTHVFIKEFLDEDGNPVGDDGYYDLNGYLCW